jgi:hypothetical protein
VVKENNEKNNAKSEESVSLNPEEETSSKTESNESRQQNQERDQQDSSQVGESTRGQDSEVRSATSGELPREEENRLLKPEETEGKGGTEKEPPLPVSKKKRKFINEEEAPAPSENSNRGSRNAGGKRG